MRHKTLKQLATLSAGMGLMIILSDYPARGATFSVKQNGFSGEPFVSGTFSGEDTNQNNVLEINELNNFNSTLVASSVSFSLDDLNDFEYILDTKNSIFFNVQKTIEVNNEFANYEQYMLAVNGFTSSSGLVIYYYLDLNDNPFAVADGASNQPVIVSAVPEPLTIGGAIVAGLLGASFRQKLASQKAKSMHKQTECS